jgi:hypothetical protein
MKRLIALMLLAPAFADATDLPCMQYTRWRLVRPACLLIPPASRLLPVRSRSLTHIQVPDRPRRRSLLME